jgi:glyoxylase-like metal-dependent hydrolase (beta-lactamase superfamily II)
VQERRRQSVAGFGGLWFNLGGIEIPLNPASGMLVQYAKRKVKATKLKAIVLSHEHLDHSSDVNVMIVATTEGVFHRRGTLLAPSDALHDDPVVLHYVRPFLERLEVLKEGGATGQATSALAVLLVRSVTLDSNPVDRRVDSASGFANELAAAT